MYVIGTNKLGGYWFWHLIPWMEDVAWHMSYFGDTQAFLKKISSFSDEVDLDVLTSSRIKDLVSQVI
jgi:hypothetical protein